MGSKNVWPQGEKNSAQHFGECAVALRDILYQDVPLSEAECLHIDNHFHVLEMAYLRWKRKHSLPLSALDDAILKAKTT
jgi:hypothetical protein